MALLREQTLLALAVFAMTFASARPVQAASFDSSIDQICRRALAKGVAGISIGVEHHHTIILRSCGEADRSAHTPVSPSTVFHVASVSKYILAAAVLHLVDKGSVHLDDDIRKYIPEAPTHGYHVTVRELLSQTSGIHSFTSLASAAANEALDLDHAQVLSLFANSPLDFGPGTSWRYDNSAFYLAGMLVERITGVAYGDYVREQFFAPLHMSSASLCDSRSSPPALARGYIMRGSGLFSDPPPMSWRLPFAAGAICATAQDLLKWERGLDEGRIISRASLLKMRQSTKLPGGVSIDYGFGTRLGQLQGHPIVGHTGSGGGYAAVLEHFTRDDLTIAVLTNTDSGPPASVAAAIARTALGLGQPRQGNPAPQPKTLAAVSGIYDSDEGPVELFSCGSRLCFRLPGATAAATPLKWLGDHRFAVDDDEVVQFLGGIGHPTWLEVYSGGLMMDAKQRVH